MNKPLLFFIPFLLTACDQHLKPHYILDNSPIYQYQGGDQLRYSVLDDSSISGEGALGFYSLEFIDTTQLHPTASFQTLHESFSAIENFSPPFVTRHVSYNDEGDMELTAITTGGEVFWLSEEGVTSSSILYFAQTEETPQTYTTSRTLQICNANSCENSGEITIKYAYKGSELAKTSYADFDTHVIGINIAINIIQNALSTTTKLYTLSGTEWIYPPLGVVKYEYDVTNNTDQVSLRLIGHLSQTNISIPESLNQTE